MPRNEYELVRLANGACAVYAAAYDEKMHPGLGPAVEAETLYVRQLRIRERLAQHEGEFVVWDIGLGAAANALTLLRLTRDLPCPLHIVSFDDTAEALQFALRHAAMLDYFQDYEATVKSLLEHRLARFSDGMHEVNWQFHLGDFPAWLERRFPVRRVTEAVHQRDESEPAAPHAIFFDAFSPAKNPAMWTLPLFTNLFRLLDRQRPCSLTTYSRSTMIRVTLLLAGFFVGRGVATGPKEETTIAANARELIEQPLDRRWLERARRSDSAEPLHAAAYRQGQLSDESWERLRAHPQFR